MNDSIWPNETRFYGEMIKLARKEFGWSQKKLAERLKITQGFLSKMEENEIRIRYVYILDLVEIFGFPVGFYKQKPVHSTNNIYMNYKYQKDHAQRP